ncbi:hypothetical protein Tco_0206761 [Tanacetum coccineum]
MEGWGLRTDGSASKAGKSKNPRRHQERVEKLLDAGLIYPISDSPWVSPVHWWRVCIDYRKLNEATRKDHFPLLFMDQMLERLAGKPILCFSRCLFGLFTVSNKTRRTRKATFTCPYGTFAYRRMPFGLCNAPGTFQRCMMAIFHDIDRETREVLWDDFSRLRGFFLLHARSHFGQMHKRCEDTNLVLNWEKSHFMVKEGIVLGTQNLYKSDIG